jgi:hypothetical protein
MGVPLRQLLQDMGYSPQQQAASWPRPTRRWRRSLAEPETLPDPTPAQLAEAARIDAVEGITEVAGMVEGEASGVEGGAQTFPREYVEQLRKENAERRKRAEELEGRNAKLVAGLLRAEVVADGRLADPADLLDGADSTALVGDDGAPDPEKVKAAVSELLARKPHCAKRISGDVGQGARPGPADPNEELWGLIQSRTR